MILDTEAGLPKLFYLLTLEVKINTTRVVTRLVIKINNSQGLRIMLQASFSFLPCKLSMLCSGPENLKSGTKKKTVLLYIQKKMSVIFYFAKETQQSSLEARLSYLYCQYQHSYIDWQDLQGTSILLTAVKKAKQNSSIHLCLLEHLRVHIVPTM